MYQPKLPVTGVTVFTLGFVSIYQISLISLLIITLTLIFFRFFRLIIKEGNYKIFYIVGILLVIFIFSSHVIGVKITNSKVEESRNIIEDYLHTQQNATNNVNKLNNITDYEQRTSRIKGNNSIVYNDVYKSGDILGIIYIDKISLELPIIEESTDENLYLGAAHIKGTPQYWKKGNSFLASHNIKHKKILFSRINELKVGDKIIISNSHEVFIYRVYNIEIVEENNIECFNKLSGDYDLSLVTCTNTGNKRYIVYSSRT